VASGIVATQQRYGNDGVGVFGGGGLTNEKAYTLGKFARVALKTSAIDYNGRFCMSSAAAAGIRAFGIDRRKHLERRANPSWRLERHERLARAVL